MNRITLMVKSTVLLSGLGLALALSSTTLAPGGLAAGGNRCTDRCADRYKIRRDACRVIPFKTERKVCERRAKEAKDDCKHRCR